MGGRPHFQVTCAFPELCPPSCGSHFSPSRAPRGGKEYVKAIYCHLAYQLLCRVHHLNAGLDEAQAGIKMAGRNVNNVRYVDDTTLMEESEEELKGLLMKVKKLA